MAQGRGSREWLWTELRCTATFLLIGVIAEIVAFVYWANGAIGSSEEDINLYGVFLMHGRPRLIGWLITFLLISSVRLGYLALHERRQQRSV